MFADPDFLMMFAQQLATNDVAILCDDSHEAIHVFGMFSDKLGKFLQLALEALKTPGQFAHGFCGFVRRPGRRLGSPTRERRHNDISLHAFSFFHGGILRTLAVSIIRRRREVNVSASFLFPWRPAKIRSS
jgi:hypothetical protein